MREGVSANCDSLQEVSRLPRLLCHRFLLLLRVQVLNLNAFYFSSAVAQICFDFLLQSPLPLVLSSRGCSNPRLLSSLSPSSMIIDALLSSATLPTWALQLARTVMGRGCTSRLIASKGVLLNFHHGYGNNSDSSLNNTLPDQDIFPACTSTTTTTCLMGDGFSPQALMTMTEPRW